MSTSPVIARQIALFESLINIVGEVADETWGLNTADHHSDLAEALSLTAPNLMNVVATKPRPDAEAAVLTALQQLRTDRPWLFYPNPSAIAAAATWLAADDGARPVRSGSRWVSYFSTCERDGIEVRRRIYADNVRKLTEMGKSDLVDTTPHKRTDIGPFTNPADPRNLTYKTERGPTVGASRHDMSLARGLNVVAGEPSRRRPEPAVRLIDSAGNVTAVPASNVSDYLALRGYRVPSAGAPGSRPAPSTPAPEAPPVANVSAEAPPAPVSKLAALREQAEAAGVVIDRAWGKKRLSKEIAGAAGAAPDAATT